MAGNIFINYRRDESGHVAGRLHDALAPKFGRNKLFMDVDNIPVGRDFEEYLKSQVAACDAMLAVIGPNWLAAKDDTGKRRLDNPDDFIVIEIGTALTRNIPVVPVLVDGARMPKASELPDSLKLLARRQAIQVRHTNFRSDAEALVKRLREAVGDDSPERGWRVRVAIGVAAVAVLLLIGWGGYELILKSGWPSLRRNRPSNNEPAASRRTNPGPKQRQTENAKQKPSDNVKKAKRPAGPATMIELWRTLTKRSDLTRTTLWPFMTEASLTRTKATMTEPLPITTRRSGSIPRTLSPFSPGVHLWE